MIVYKCAISGAELFTDAYKVEEVDGLYQIRGKFTSRNEKVDESKFGANASSEEPQETVDDPSEQSGVDIILDNRLTSTGFGSKKEFTVYFKGYVKKLEAIKKEKDPSIDVDAWRAKLTAAFKVLSANYKEYELYTGDINEPDASLAYLRWETLDGEKDEVPFVYFFKEGLLEQKV